MVISATICPDVHPMRVSGAESARQFDKPTVSSVAREFSRRIATEWSGCKFRRKLLAMRWLETGTKAGAEEVS